MSLSAAVLKKMMEKGLSIADAVEIAEVWEEGCKAPAKSSAAIRQKRYRDRQNAKSEEVSDAETVTETITRDVTDDRNEGEKKVSPTPPSKKYINPRLLTETAPSRNDHHTDFEAWWEVYPRKVGKGSARKAYSAARRKTTAENLLGSLVAATFDADQKFIPHPATWLNGERWLDSPQLPPSLPVEAADPWPSRVKRFRMSGYWDSDWGPKPGKPGCLAPTEPAESQAA